MNKQSNNLDIKKINSITFKIAFKIKSEIEKTRSLKKAELSDPTIAVPIDEHEFLKYLIVKYLNVTPEEGIPILHQAYNEQYSIENDTTIKNEVKL